MHRKLSHRRIKHERALVECPRVDKQSWGTKISHTPQLGRGWQIFLGQNGVCSAGQHQDKPAKEKVRPEEPDLETDNSPHASRQSKKHHWDKWAGIPYSTSMETPLYYHCRLETILNLLVTLPPQDQRCVGPIPYRHQRDGWRERVTEPHQEVEGHRLFMSRS